jgi:thiol-disulfide isomerase/thioredoxin
LNSRAIGLDGDYLRYAALLMLALWSVWLWWPRQECNRWAYIAHHGYVSGMCLGALIGLVWTPYASHLLASAWLDIIREQDNVNAVRVIIAFTAGIGVSLWMLILIGRCCLSVLQRYASVFRKVLGLWLLCSVWLMAAGSDVALWPSPYQDTLATLAKRQQYQFDPPYPAPAIAPSVIWLNTPGSRAIGLDSLKGKVVLVDFWTYSCINCLRTLPYLKAWYDKYHAQGLEIIGVHSPEFDFEKQPSNVWQAIRRYGIPYPVALDNQLDTWNNFHNQYWPAHYLIDRNGNVVYSHFGEGQYATMENNIRVLLGLGVNDRVGLAEALPTGQTPETYLGFRRANTFQSEVGLVPDQSFFYFFPKVLPLNHWALAGRWAIEAERIVSQGDMSRLKLSFKAKKLFLVLGSTTGSPISVQLRLNGEVLKTAAGWDVVDGRLQVKQHRLYQLVNQAQTMSGVLEVIAAKPGLAAYAFTFG